MEKNANILSLVKKIMSRALVRLPISDEQYIRLRFRYRYHRNIDLQNPKTLMEKFNWMKLNMDLSQYSHLADKYEVRSFISKEIGAGYLNDLYALYHHASEIVFPTLPDSFALKATHGCGMNYFCRNKSELDETSVRKLCQSWMGRNHYYHAREEIYRHIKPRIMCEKLLHANDREDINDYKLFCFNGKPGFIQVDIDRYLDHKRNFYDISWSRLPYCVNYPNFPDEIQRPLRLQEMIEVASVLSRDFPFVRVDLYEVDQKVIFGELTFLPEGGFSRISLQDDLEMGQWFQVERLETRREQKISK